MTPYTAEQLRAIDIQIYLSLAQLDADDGLYRAYIDAWEAEELPHYTTDANAALLLMQPGWSLERHDYGWRVRDTEEQALSLMITPALAICRAHYPELFAALEEAKS